MNLVIVESPAKAKTIEKFLGPDYRVLATFGHVCDLAAKNGSVRPDEEFAMDYVADPKAAKHIKAISDAAGNADALLLATDPDREGEAISWHVLNQLKERGKLKSLSVKRVVFHAITRNAVLEAVANPRELDMNMVNAQQARRALDYLVGFTLSPVLWRKVPGSRSAGRVQSVALRLIADRELEIEAFVAREYWTVDVGLLTAAGKPVAARLTRLDDKKLEKFSIAEKAAAERAVAEIKSRDFAVESIDRKQVRRNPQPPFTTSTLQQEASRKLGFAAKRTMQVAQKLYEGINLGGETVGLITYMRTDSIVIAPEGLQSCRATIAGKFGDTYVPDKPRTFQNRAKNAQEAHEAIRPSDFERAPDQVSGYLDPDGARLYELIWKRGLASQMASARLDQVAVDFQSPDKQVTLRANGSVVVFDGFLKLYEEGRDDGEGGSDRDRRLPAMTEGESTACETVSPEQHFTEPPPRYGEATLVKRLEELGIGRPSTYASIISVLQDREYVRLEKKRFVPESRGRLVTVFLESFFERYVRYDFTAELENQLDLISKGELDWKLVLKDFWTAFSAAVEDISELRITEVLNKLDEVLGPHIFRDDGTGRDTRACPTCDDGRLSLKLGKFGAFIGCSNYPDCRYTRQLSSGDGDGDGAQALEGPKVLGQDADGNDISLRKGPYGFYLQRGEPEKDTKPQRVSLPKGTDLAEVDLANALALLALPREVGAHPESGKEITAGIGRYGPYLKHQGKYKSLAADDDVLTIGLNRAVALLAEAGRGRPGAEPIKMLGTHPDDGTEIGVFSGRYGPYVRYKRVFATLPKDTEPEDVTLEQALELIAVKAAKMGTGRKPAAKKKTATKKTTAKKTTAKRKSSTARKPKAAANTGTADG